MMLDSVAILVGAVGLFLGGILVVFDGFYLVGRWWAGDSDPVPATPRAIRRHERRNRADLTRVLGRQQ